MNKKSSSKKKVVYSSVKMIMCKCCGIVTPHSLFDSDKGIYKCNLCKTVHAK